MILEYFAFGDSSADFIRCNLFVAIVSTGTIDYNHESLIGVLEL